LNCVANSQILNTVSGLDDMWLQPASGDAGCALGTALDVSHRIRAKDQSGLKAPMTHAYLGPEFSDRHIQDQLDHDGLIYEHAAGVDAICMDAANTLASGLVIGHFCGRSEYGPRALGNRSILADPRPADMLSRVNQKIKFREGWRPFAPMVLAEHAATYFEPPTSSPFMLLTSQIRAQFRSDITKARVRAKGLYTTSELQTAMTSDFSSATHVDWSSRLQTIDSDSPSRARRILEKFFTLTGCPMILNTSFNVRGEPIVHTPSNAIQCFLKTGLDVLYIGNFIVRKNDQSGEPAFYEECKN